MKSHRSLYFSVAAMFVMTAFALVAGSDDDAKSSRSASFPRDELYSEFRDRDGAADGRRDWDAGCPRFLLYGRSAGLVFKEKWNSLTRQRFGVKVESIAGCLVTDEVVRYAKEYNRVVLSLVADRFGSTAWVDCHTEAVEAFRKDSEKKTAEPGATDNPGDAQ